MLWYPISALVWVFRYLKLSYLFSLNLCSFALFINNKKNGPFQWCLPSPINKNVYLPNELYLCIYMYILYTNLKYWYSVNNEILWNTIGQLICVLELLCYPKHSAASYYSVQLHTLILLESWQMTYTILYNRHFNLYCLRFS